MNTIETRNGDTKALFRVLRAPRAPVRWLSSYRAAAPAPPFLAPEGEMILNLDLASGMAAAHHATKAHFNARRPLEAVNFGFAGVTL